MTQVGTVDIRGAALAITLAAVGVAGAFLGLATVASPRDAVARASALEDAQRTAAAASRSDLSKAYNPDVVCAGPAAAAVQALRSRVMTVAAGSEVTLANLNVAAAPPGDGGVTLTTINLQFEASGQYDAVLQMLGALASSHPSIFVDTADLTTQTSSVAFKFQGRMFCSAYARL